MKAVGNRPVNGHLTGVAAIRPRSYAANRGTDTCNRMSRPRSQRATVRDVAAETGVSIATVSRVLNNQAHVAPHTRDLVQRAVERLSKQTPGPGTFSAHVARRS